MLLLPRLLSLLFFTIAANLSFAQVYPTKAVRMIVPFPPGAGVDIVSRAVSGRLAEALGQQLIIDNRAGAGAFLVRSLLPKPPPTVIRFSWRPPAFLPCFRT